MELALSALMVIGIFVAIPALIGFTLAGVYIWRDHQFRKAERARAVEEVEALHAAAAGERLQVEAEEQVKERVKVV